MNFWLLITLLFIIPFALFLAYLVVSSCLGDSFRARVSGFSVNPRHATYDKHYLRTMTNSGSGLSEQIELQDFMEDSMDYGYEE